MRDHKRQWKLYLLGALIVLCSWAAPANAGPFQSSGNANLGEEFSAFLTDFGPWNASHNDLPLLFLEVTPSQDRGEAFLLLWWLWMRSQGHAHSSPPSMGGPPPTSGPGGNTAEPPIGTIGSGSNGNGTPPILGGGNGSQDNGGTPPIGLPMSNPSLQGPVNGPSTGEPSPSSGGLASPSVSSVPEPSSLALLGSGALGMLTYGWGRWRTARRGTGAH